MNRNATQMEKIKCCVLRITCKKVYRLVLVFCWFLVASVLLIRSQDVLVYSKHMGFYKVQAFLSAISLAGSTQSKYIPFVSMLDGDVHIYSAIARNSSKYPFFDTIRLNGWELVPLRNSQYFCCLYYDRNDIERHNFTEKLHWNFLGHAKLETKQFVCPNPRHQNRTLPLAVSLSQNKCPDNSSLYIQVETPETVASNKSQIAVCTKLAFGNLSFSEMIEWFEIQKLLGVSRVITYTNKLNADAMKVLKHYHAEGLAQYYPFFLPDTDRFKRSVGVKNFQSWNDEQVVVLDCHARLAEYTYIGLYDMDEFVVPKKQKTLVELLENLRNLAPRAAGFTFKTEIYATTWGKMGPSNTSDLIVSQYLNRTAPMRDRVKSIIITKRVEPGRLSTHGYWPKKGSNYNKPVVPEQYATLKHYRSCRKEWLRKSNGCIGYRCYKEIVRITDKSMLEWAHKIENNWTIVAMEIQNNGN